MSNLHARLMALAPERRACFALACAERLVVRTATPRRQELLTVLEHGWSALVGPRTAVPTLRSQLVAREDLDDDDVAAVVYALDAVLGEDEGAYWAASRALDAAFERVSEAYGDTEFRPLAVDAADRVVRQEIVSQQKTLAAVEGGTELTELVQEVRLT